MIRLAVCDDNPLHAQEAERLASGCLTEARKSFRVQRFSSAEEMLQAVQLSCQAAVSSSSPPS